MIIWNIILTLAVIALAWIVWHLWQYMSGIESQDDHEDTAYVAYEIGRQDGKEQVKKWPCNIEPYQYDLKGLDTKPLKEWMFKTEDRVDDK